jgi:hypothetical protein
MSSRIAEIREGFEVLKDRFEVPTELMKLHRANLVAMSICDMFVNRGSSISLIAQALNITSGNVVTTLIAEGMLKDRRKKPH